MSITSRIKSIEQHIKDIYDALEQKGANIKILPNEYQEVEYIQSSGTQYIDTGIAPNDNTKVETKLFNNSISSWYIFGSRGIRTGVQYFSQTGANSGDTIVATVNSASTNPGWTRNSSGALYEILLETRTDTYNYSISDLTNNREYSVNGVSYTPLSSVDPTQIPNILIFAQRPTNIIDGTTRVYSFKIYQDGDLVRNLIPCYRKSDDKPGMYDLVNDTFYTNAGTGTFIKGANHDEYINKNIVNIIEKINELQTI